VLRSIIPFIAVTLLAASDASASGGDAYMCRNGLFSSDVQTLTLMRAVGKPRTYFLWDKDTAGCPSDTKSCRHSYVLPGQEVIAGKASGDFICAFYPNQVGGSAGWVSAHALAPAGEQPSRDPPLRAWAGKWVDGEDSIAIGASAGLLHASGSAVWHGWGDNVHVGEFEGGARPSGARVVFAQDTCSVTATLLGRYLIVSDNENCGGMNVRFDGVYRRASAR
jgi:hypothetical protein